MRGGYYTALRYFSRRDLEHFTPYPLQVATAVEADTESEGNNYTRANVFGASVLTGS